MNRLVVVDDKVVTIAVARSQKTSGPGAMNKEEFQQSKDAVLDYVAGLIGVDSATLASQVSNSSDGPSQASDRTDTPAASTGLPRPGGDAAGVPPHDEASDLSDDWRDVYIQNLSGIRDKAASLLHRHSDAMQMLGGTPTERELAWMRLAWRLVHRRNEGQLKRGEWDVELEKLKTMPLPPAKRAA
jgi:hypothetical protein